MTVFTKKRILFVLVLVCVASLAVACGGEESSSTTSTAGSSVSTPKTPTAMATGDLLVGTQIKATEATPTEYAEAIQQGKPVVILFYLSGGADDVKVLDSVTQLQAAFPDCTFLVYDSQLPDAYGDLSSLLQVDYPPEVVLVDRSGTIREIWNGYVDEGTLNQCLTNLVQL